MLTFYYGGHKVHIDHTGKAEYWRVDDQYRYARVEGEDWVVTDTPPAHIVQLSGAMLQLIATETTKAMLQLIATETTKMRVSQLAQELQATKATLERAVYEQCAAESAISDCTIKVGNVSAQLKNAEGALQLARTGG